MVLIQTKIQRKKIAFHIDTYPLVSTFHKVNYLKIEAQPPIIDMQPK